jgi:tRNA A37 threonylcarbamoyladenosine synthetase subunit TsaC/SUA5/YrdC
MWPNKIYLAQTDTTVGFLSQDAKRLAAIKGRPANKPFLMEVASFEELKKRARVPKKFRRFVRQAKKSTFVYPNGQALRVVKEELHLRFLKKFGWMYSTSANPSGGRYDPKFAKEAADVVVVDKRGLFEGAPSRILRLGKSTKRRVR